MAEEMLLLPAAELVYLAAAVLGVAMAARGRLAAGRLLGLIALALSLHTGSIALRWLRLGHGPYVDLFEILSSNVWSPHLALLLLALAFRSLRAALPTALAVLSVLVAWLALTEARDTLPPVTYQTI